MSIKKKNQEQIQDDASTESGDEGSLSVQDKLTRKQRLIKLFMTTELKRKNKHLWKPLRDAKSSLVRNFKDGSFQSSDINKLFWIYFNEDKDIFVGKHLKKYLTEYNVTMDGSSEDFGMTLQQYLSFLEYVRTQVNPFVQKVKPLVSTATAYARNFVAQEFSDGAFTDYQAQDEAKSFRDIAKEKLLELMQPVFQNKNLYTMDRFNQEKKVIYNKLMHSAYTSFCTFALLGFHLFDKKQEVFNAFTEEELDKVIDLAFPPDFSLQCPIKLRDLLTFISQLNFKEQFFKMK